MFFSHSFLFSDIQECLLQVEICNFHGNCTELAGSYMCDCDPGWFGNQCGQGQWSYIIFPTAKILMIVCKIEDDNDNVPLLYFPY